MRRIRTILGFLLRDERSAVRRDTAVLFTLVVLGTAVTGVILMSFGEQTYRDLDRRVLRAAHELADGPLV